MNAHPSVTAHTKHDATQQGQALARRSFAGGQDAIPLYHLLIAFVSLTGDVRGTMVGNPRVALFGFDVPAPRSPASGLLATRICLASAESIRSGIQRMRQHGTYSHTGRTPPF